MVLTHAQYIAQILSKPEKAVALFWSKLHNAAKGDKIPRGVVAAA